MVHKGIHDIGATNYGKPELIIEVAKLTYSTSKYMLEKFIADGLGKWPSWFYGVTTMYAGEIAVNHLINDFIQAPEKMDCRSDSGDYILQQVHIHSYHTYEIFSKFKFEVGEYDHIDFSTLDLDIVKEYCLYMALTSKIMKNKKITENIEENISEFKKHFLKYSKKIF